MADIDPTQRVATEVLREIARTRSGTLIEAVQLLEDWELANGVEFVAEPKDWGLDG